MARRTGYEVLSFQAGNCERAKEASARSSVRKTVRKKEHEMHEAGSTLSDAAERALAEGVSHPKQRSDEEAQRRVCSGWASQGSERCDSIMRGPMAQRTVVDCTCLYGTITRLTPHPLGPYVIYYKKVDQS